MARKTYSITLLESHDIAPQVRHFVFTVDDAELLDYIPGQFITLVLDIPGLDKPLRRSYSIASTGKHPHKLEFAASYVENGRASQILFDLQPGDALTATGPFGRLILKPEESPSRFFFMATGTGITPYLTMLPSIKERLAQDLKLEAHILFGTRTAAEALYRDEFINAASTQARLHYHACYSRADTAGPEPYEHSGHIQKQLAKLAPKPDTDIIYLCGNPNMIDDTFNYLIELGFDSKAIRREKYISNG